MTKDDIIRMAREAGFADGVAEIVGLEGFANFFADNKKALEAALEQQQAAQTVLDLVTDHGVHGMDRALTALRTALEQAPNRQALQAAGTHSAPCARHCEAKAYEIEIRLLNSALREAQEQRKLLTDDQLDEIAVIARGGNLHDLRIAIEAAHNIK
jgi:hypothetical protein